MGAELEALDDVPIARTLRPVKATEVAGMLADASVRGAALLPSGGMSKLHWGNRSDADELERLDLSGLVEPLEVNADEGIACVGAGVTVAELERKARAVGKRTRLPSLYGGATIGGTIAADPIGPDTLPEARLRNELLGLEVALVNGELTQCGGRVVKNVTGFDLVRMYCGSFGTLGVITRATLRLWPVPERRTVLVRVIGSVDTAIETAQVIFARGVEPAGLVVLPDPEGARLVWVVEGAHADAEDRAGRVLGESADEARWAEAARAVSGGPPPGIDGGPPPGIDGGPPPGIDGGPPPGIGGAAGHENGGVCVRLAGRLSDTLPITRAVTGAGGRLRVALPALGVVLADIDEDALARLEQDAEAGRWTLIVERASADSKARRDVFGAEPQGLALMRALKNRFDPSRILNPGRFVGRL